VKKEAEAWTTTKITTRFPKQVSIYLLGHTRIGLFSICRPHKSEQISMTVTTEKDHVAEALTGHPTFTAELKWPADKQAKYYRISRDGQFRGIAHTG